jgi:acyl-CoA synthetase (AMP-forming)/AMP-acid ligase II
MKQNAVRDHGQIATKFTSLADVPRLHAASSPDAVAISFEGRHTTHGDRREASSRVAIGLRAIGAGASDRVAILDRNVDRFSEFDALIAATSRQLNIIRRSFSDQEIHERLIYTLLISQVDHHFGGLR